MLHRESRLGIYKPAWGNLEAVISNTENTSLVFMALEGNPSGMYAISRVIFNGALVSESKLYERVIFHLSPDGTKLALAKPRVQNGKRNGYDIFVNGEKKYDCPLGTIHYLAWFSNDELLWNGWYEDEQKEVKKQADEKGVRYFRNGVDTTGRFEYQPFIWGDIHHGLWIADYENDRSYEIFDDDRVVERGKARGLMDGWKFKSDTPKPAPEQPEAICDKKRGSTRVSYRGVSGPIFHGLEHGGGMCKYVYNEDRSHLEYCGIAYSGLADKMARFAAWTFNTIKHIPVVRSLVGWPLALLFNPYMGIGHFWIEGSRRWTPVSHPNPWKAKYRFAKPCFFTASNELVVLAADKNGWFVAIDEEEGPRFDGIENVRPMKDGGVCYIGRNGIQFYRVVAK